jgi:tripartite-type tricarboxylate transporter receptor subunit TctC
MRTCRHDSQDLIVFRAASFCLLALITALCTAIGHAAEAYPSKPLRLIVPFAPGGAADILARVIGEHLQRDFGKPIVIVNREGAGTIIGVDAAAKATPDGYTLLLSGDAATINTASGRPLPYDLLKDLQPISLVYSGTQFLLVNAKDNRFGSLRDFVQHAKAHPATLKFGSSGVATSTHLSAETINAAAGIKGVHVPYRGIAPAMNNLAGGHVDYAIVGSSAAIPAVQNGQFKALATTGRSRSPSLPSVPTLIEQGVNAETGSWYGLFAPAGTPAARVKRLNAATVSALRSSEVTERLKSLGGEARPTTPDEARDFMRAEIARFATLMRKLDIKVAE